MLAIVAAAGCGGGSDDGASGSAAQTAIEAGAQERAESSLLQLSDFPEGWRASTPDEEDTEGQEKFRACIGVDYSALTRTGDAQSRDFEMLSEEASSQTSVFEDAEQAETALDRFVSGISGAEVGDCVGDLLKESAPAENQEEFEVGEVEVGELNVTLPDVEQATAWQIAVTLEFTSGEAAGLSPEIYIDQIHVREGDAIATLQTVDVLTPFDPELRDELLQTIADRLSE